MGIKDLISSGGSEDDPGVGESGAPGLDDRTVGYGQSSPDTNQSKTEPMPPTPGHTDPDAGPRPATSPPPAPDLDEMGAGMANAQVASPSGVALPGGSVARDAGEDRPGGAGGAGRVPSEDRPEVGPSSSTGRSAGPEMPESQTQGVAHRAPGLLGEPGAYESLETDVEQGAARTSPERTPPASDPRPLDAPGDSHAVAVPHTDAAEGTSEESAMSRGIKAPSARGQDEPGA